MSQTEYAVEVATSTAFSLIDCDVHNYPNSIDDLMPYLSARWQAYVRQSGFSGPPGPTYPKGFAQAARRDAWPPSGLRPGGDPDFARTQLLDAWGIDVAVLNPLYGMTALHNLDFANALMRAVNEWTAHAWLDHDPRWLGSIVVNANDPAAAAAEIKRAAADPRFVQALLLVRSSAPYGKRQFRPIFAAAARSVCRWESTLAAAASPSRPVAGLPIISKITRPCRKPLRRRSSALFAKGCSASSRSYASRWLRGDSRGCLG